MSQIGISFLQGDPGSRSGVSNVSLSPTTENKRVTISLKGGDQSLAFQEDLAAGRSFREARFETSAYESVFSNVGASSVTAQLGRPPALPIGRPAAAPSFGKANAAPTLIVDDRSPATGTFRINPSATFGPSEDLVYVVDDGSMLALEAAERECDEDLQQELRSERSLWKYGRR